MESRGEVPGVDFQIGSHVWAEQPVKVPGQTVGEVHEGPYAGLHGQDEAILDQGRGPQMGAGRGGKGSEGDAAVALQQFTAGPGQAEAQSWAGLLGPESRRDNEEFVVGRDRSAGQPSTRLDRAPNREAQTEAGSAAQVAAGESRVMGLGHVGHAPEQLLPEDGVAPDPVRDGQTQGKARWPTAHARHVAETDGQGFGADLDRREIPGPEVNVLHEQIGRYGQGAKRRQDGGVVAASDQQPGVLAGKEAIQQREEGVFRIQGGRVQWRGHSE